jgi:transmembrane sensor
MKRFIKMLLFRDKTKKPPVFKKQEDALYYKELKNLWNISSKTKMPAIPDPEQAWITLKYEMARADKKQPSIITKLIDEFIYRPVISYSFVTVLIAGLIFYFNMENGIYQTNRGEFLSVDLPDQTHIELNCDSKLSYEDDYNQTHRDVQLQGEAYFKVMKGKIPFVIKSVVANVTVIGTEFNLKIRNERLEVAVNEGVVELRSTVGEKDSTVHLEKGSWSTCMKGGFPDKPHALPFQSYPAWLRNELICDKTPLWLVCQEIERRFDTSIYLEDKALDTITITGIFKLNDINQLLLSVCKLIKKDYKYEEGIYFIF